jgi:hypothetical protein
MKDKPKVMVLKTPKDGTAAELMDAKEAALWLRDRGYYRSQSTALKALMSGIVVNTMFSYFELKDSHR